MQYFRYVVIALVSFTVSVPAIAGVITFDTTVPQIASPPFPITEDGITATIQSSGFAVQTSVNGFLTLVGPQFSGQFLGPNFSAPGTSLQITFSKFLDSITFGFATADLTGDPDVTTKLTVQLFSGSTFLNSSAIQGSYTAGATWAQGTFPLFMGNGNVPFDTVVISGPARFAIDNLEVTPASPTNVPEPGTCTFMLIGALPFALLLRRRG